MKQLLAEPFQFEFEQQSIALLMIDMQRDFIEEGGFGAALGNDVSRLRAIIPTAKLLLDVFRRHRLPIIHTRECHRPDLADLPKAKHQRGKPELRIGDVGPMGRILIAGEAGADIIPELYPKAGEVIIDKPGKGAFYNTHLTATLEGLGIRQLIFAGVTTEVCVQTTMREANDRGYDCLLAEDATESYFPHFKSATIDMITAQGGIVGWVANTASIVEALDE